MAPVGKHFTTEQMARIKGRAVKFGSWYKIAALLTLNTIVVFVLLNMILWGVFVLWPSTVDSFGRDKTESDNSMPQKLATVYPGYNSAAILRLRQESSYRPLAYEPYIHFKEGPFHGAFVNVSDYGFRENRVKKTWPPDKQAFNIFLFGGSTMFGYGAPDEHTVASFLEEYFNSQNPSLPVRVYNFGQGYYYSSQEAVLFMRLLSKGNIPHAAIFVDGLNDFLNVADEPVFTDQYKEIFNSEYDGSMNPKLINNLMAKYLPIYKFAEIVRSSFNKQTGDRAQSDTSSKLGADDNQRLNNVISRYFNNKRVIEGMGNRFGVKTIFVWQPVPNYKYDISYHLFSGPVQSESRYKYTRFGYPLIKEYLDRHPVDGNFIWAADTQEDMQEPLYVDSLHYRPEFMKVLADYIGNEVVRRQLINFTVQRKNGD